MATLKNIIGLILCIIFFLSCLNQEPPKQKNKKTVTKHSNVTYTSRLKELHGSKDMQELLSQHWELQDDLEGIENNDAALGIIPFRSFYLSPDSTFVKNPRNMLEYGKWNYHASDKTIVLKYAKGGQDTYKLAALAANELVVVNSGIKSITLLKYVSKGSVYKNKIFDPFHIDNNRWRIKPAKMETAEQVRKRVKAYVHFHVLFYQDNLAHASRTISFYGFPTCLKWYAGGIYLIPEKDLEENWYRCFYNREQALQGAALLGKLLTQKYHWPEGNESWVVKNLSVLLQLQERI